MGGLRPPIRCMGPWRGIGGLGQGHQSAWTIVTFLLQADELDGEIDLRSCTDVTEYAVQRNYGFQIHVRLHAAGGWHGWRAPRRWCWCGAQLSIRDWLLSLFIQRRCPQSQSESLLPTLTISGEIPGIIGRGSWNGGEILEPARLFQG